MVGKIEKAIESVTLQIQTKPNQPASKGECKMIVKSAKDLKTLTKEDWYRGVQFMVSAEANILGPNEHRDVENYPRIESKVTDIMASIKASKTTDEIESGLWWNQEFGIYSVPDITGIKFNVDGFVTEFPQTQVGSDEFPLRRISGHHRGWAADDLKFRFHAGTVRIINRDTRYRMMANENFDTYSAHPLAQMETIKQGSLILWGYATEYEDWQDVEAAHAGVFSSETAWKSILRQGVGKKALMHYLGKPWTITSISYLLRMVKNVENGVFTTKEIAKLPSISVANGLGTLLTTLHDDMTMWPLPFRNELAHGCLETITHPNNIATVKVIADARDFMLNQLADPVKYLKTRTITTFDSFGRLKALIKANVMAASKEGKQYDSATLLDEGFEGCEAEIAKAVKELKEGVAPSAPETAETASSDVSAEADAAADAVTAEVPEVPGADALAAATEEAPDISDAGEVDPATVVKDFIDGAYDLEILCGRLMDIDIDYQNEGNLPLVKAISTVYKMLHMLVSAKLPATEDNLE